MNNTKSINELIIRLIENQISENDFQSLSEFLSKGPLSVQYYCEFLDDYVSIKTEIESEIAQVNKGNGVLLDYDLWQAMAEHELIAEPVENAESSRECPQIVAPKDYRIKKFSLYANIASGAAILLIIFYAVLFTAPAADEVAALADMIGAEWGEGKSYESGKRFSLNDGPIFLKKGIVKIEYDKDVQVTIEGPAEFEINSPTAIRLGFGCLYAHVFEYGRGFTVNTHNSQIIDLGTEFGVRTERNGSTELHVFKGVINLMAIDTNRRKIISEQRAGQAVIISEDSSDLKVREIPLKQNVFVQDICSETQVIWKGEKQISLADIVGGGNGLEGGAPGSGWNPATGQYVQRINLHEWPKSKNSYSRVSTHPFIDGVFVPDGGRGPVILNSESQKSTDIEDTTGVYRFEISNGPAVWKRGRLPNAEIPPMEFYMQDLTLNGIPYGTVENPAIYMHTNAGITFDLSAIRTSFSASNIEAFSAICGEPDQIREQLTNDLNALLSVYVFLNDQCCFKAENLSKTDKPILLWIPIQPENRFLTLVVADADNNPAYDWCLFANPVLELSSK